MCSIPLYTVNSCMYTLQVAFKCAGTHLVFGVALIAQE